MYNIHELRNIRLSEYTHVNGEYIGNESFISDIRDKFVSALSSASSFFRKNILGNGVNLVIFKEFQSKKKLVDKLVKRDYLSIAHVDTPVTSGLKVNLLDLYQNITNGNSVLDGFVIRALEETSLTLAKVISDSDFRKTFYHNETILKSIEAANNNIDEVLKKTLDPNEYIDLKPIGFLIPNMSSLSVVSLNADTLCKHLEKVHGTVSNMNTLIKNISDKINVIVKQSTDDGTVYEKSTLLHVAKLVDQCAYLVTNNQYINLLATEYVNMTTNLIKTLDGFRTKNGMESLDIDDRTNIDKLKELLQYNIA